MSIYMATEKKQKKSLSQSATTLSTPEPAKEHTAPTVPESVQEQTNPVHEATADSTSLEHEPAIGDTNIVENNHQGVDRYATTKVGQVVRGLGSKLTERLASLETTKSSSSETSATPVAPVPTRRDSTGHTRERLSHLILALGDTEHPEHARAVDQLVEAGHAAVPLLKEALDVEEYHWLTAYRAAEALGRIADGRATGALIHALRHPNSNVRWSAVRALAHIGDLRALFELRRVAQEDHGRTSWGESVAGAAHSALDQIQAQSVWSQSIELVKTAVTSVLMIMSLILVFSVLTTLRNEVNQFGDGDPAIVLAKVRTAMPTVEIDEADIPGEQPAFSGAPDETLPDAQPEVVTEPDVAASEVPETEEVSTSDESITGKVLSGANIRPFPSVQNAPIGSVSQGDEIVFLGMSADGMWYHISLGERHADSSAIGDSEDGSGWVHRELVSTPKGDVPVEEIDESEDDTTILDTDSPEDETSTP